MTQGGFLARARLLERIAARMRMGGSQFRDALQAERALLRAVRRNTVEIERLKAAVAEHDLALREISRRPF